MKADQQSWTVNKVNLFYLLFLCHTDKMKHNN